jgi:hypothetical protein
LGIVAGLVAVVIPFFAFGSAWLMFNRREDGNQGAANGAMVFGSDDAMISFLANWWVCSRVLPDQTEAREDS